MPDLDQMLSLSFLKSIDLEMEAEAAYYNSSTKDQDFCHFFYKLTKLLNMSNHEDGK